MGNKHGAKRRRKGGPTTLNNRKGRCSTTTTATTNTEDLLTVISASHRKLSINNENLLSPSSLRKPSASPASSHSTEEHKTDSCHYLLLESNILENILSIVDVCPT